MGDKKEEGFQIQIAWKSPDDLPTIYANHLYITHAGEEFYLIFGEMETPVLLNVTKETVPSSLDVKPVAKIAIAPSAMLKFAEVINTNIGRYLERTARSEHEE